MSGAVRHDVPDPDLLEPEWPGEIRRGNALAQDVGICQFAAPFAARPAEALRAGPWLPHASRFVWNRRNCGLVAAIPAEPPTERSLY